MPIIDQLNTLMAANVYAVLMVFARVGTALMLMPGIGSTYTPARTRLLLALAFSVTLSPIVRGDLPPEPQDVPALFIAIMVEAAIGVFLGTISLLFMGALETAGQLIAQEIGFSNAYIFNPQAQTQSSIPGTLLAILAVVAIFSTGLYAILLRAVVESYHVFRFDSLSMIGDMSDTIAHLVGRTYTIAIEMASPFMVVGLMLYTVFGLIGRLLPQIQVFFVTLPLQIGLGCIIFSLSVGIMIEFWMHSFETSLRSLGFAG
jgi:flagellar biosynthetic protein FliR